MDNISTSTPLPEIIVCGFIRVAVYMDFYSCTITFFKAVRVK
ncbi:hypothetical protein [Rossellomorea vietnamensis]|nr:hypothetical protein [Rossellomorea vietnamensis]